MDTIHHPHACQATGELTLVHNDNVNYNQAERLEAAAPVPDTESFLQAQRDGDQIPSTDQSLVIMMVEGRQNHSPADEAGTGKIIPPWSESLAAHTALVSGGTPSSALSQNHQLAESSLPGPSLASIYCGASASIDVESVHLLHQRDRLLSPGVNDGPAVLAAVAGMGGGRQEHDLTLVPADSQGSLIAGVDANSLRKRDREAEVGFSGGETCSDNSMHQILEAGVAVETPVANLPGFPQSLRPALATTVVLEAVQQNFQCAPQTNGYTGMANSLVWSGIHKVSLSGLGSGSLETSMSTAAAPASTSSMLSSTPSLSTVVAALDSTEAGNRAMSLQTGARAAESELQRLLQQQDSWQYQGGLQGSSKRLRVDPTASTDQQVQQLLRMQQDQALQLQHHQQAQQLQQQQQHVQQLQQHQWQQQQQKLHMLLMMQSQPQQQQQQQQLQQDLQQQQHPVQLFRQQTPRPESRMEEDGHSEDDEGMWGGRNQEPLFSVKPNKGGRPRSGKSAAVVFSKAKLKLDWNMPFCNECLDSGVLVECDGACLRSWHYSCIPPWERPSVTHTAANAASTPAAALSRPPASHHALTVPIATSSGPPAYAAVLPLPPHPVSSVIPPLAGAPLPPICSGQATPTIPTLVPPAHFQSLASQWNLPPASLAFADIALNGTASFPGVPHSAPTPTHGYPPTITAPLSVPCTEVAAAFTPAEAHTTQLPTQAQSQTFWGTAGAMLQPPAPPQASSNPEPRPTQHLLAALPFPSADGFLSKAVAINNANIANMANALAPARDTAWYCRDCREGLATCTVCGGSNTGGVLLVKCKMGSCGQSYHPHCLLSLGLKFKMGSKTDERPMEQQMREFRAGKLPFACPAHFCASCHLSGDALRMARCWLCPRAYHLGKCMPESAVKLRQFESKFCECPWCAHAYRAHKGRQQASAHAHQLASSTAAAAGLPPPPPLPSQSHDRALLEDIVRGTLRDPKSLHLPPLKFAPADASWHSDAYHPTSGNQDPGGFTFHVQRLGNLQQSQTGLPTCEPAVSPSRQLIGKTHWTFGCHMKGGGVDFVVDAQGAKLHSLIIVAEDSTAVFVFQHSRRRVSPPFLNTREVAKDRAIRLAHNDRLVIGTTEFLITRVPSSSGPMLIGPNPSMMLACQPQAASTASTSSPATAALDMQRSIPTLPTPPHAAALTAAIAARTRVSAVPAAVPVTAVSHSAGALPTHSIPYTIPLHDGATLQPAAALGQAHTSNSYASMYSNLAVVPNLHPTPLPRSTSTTFPKCQTDQCGLVSATSGGVILGGGGGGSGLTAFAAAAAAAASTAPPGAHMASCSVPLIAAHMLPRAASVSAVPRNYANRVDGRSPTPAEAIARLMSAPIIRVPAIPHISHAVLLAVTSAAGPGPRVVRGPPGGGSWPTVSGHVSRSALAAASAQLSSTTATAVAAAKEAAAAAFAKAAASDAATAAAVAASQLEISGLPAFTSPEVPAGVPHASATPAPVPSPPIPPVHPGPPPTLPPSILHSNPSNPALQAALKVERPLPSRSVSHGPSSGRPLSTAAPAPRQNSKHPSTSTPLPASRAAATSKQTAPSTRLHVPPHPLSSTPSTRKELAGAAQSALTLLRRTTGDQKVDGDAEEAADALFAMASRPTRSRVGLDAIQNYNLPSRAVTDGTEPSRVVTGKRGRPATIGTDGTHTVALERHAPPDKRLTAVQGMRTHQASTFSSHNAQQQNQPKPGASYKPPPPAADVDVATSGGVKLAQVKSRNHPLYRMASDSSVTTATGLPSSSQPPPQTKNEQPPSAAVPAKPRRVRRTPLMQDTGPRYSPLVMAAMAIAPGVDVSILAALERTILSETADPTLRKPSTATALAGVAGVAPAAVPAMLSMTRKPSTGPGSRVTVGRPTPPVSSSNGLLPPLVVSLKGAAAVAARASSAAAAIAAAATAASASADASAIATAAYAKAAASAVADSTWHRQNSGVDVVRTVLDVVVEERDKALQVVQQQQVSQQQQVAQQQQVVQQQVAQQQQTALVAQTLPNPGTHADPVLQQ